jgi:hypothetical protein
VNACVLYPTALPLSFHYGFYRLSDTEYLVPISIKIQNRELSYATQPEGHLSARVDLYMRVTGIAGTSYYEFDDTIYSNYQPQEFEKRTGHYSVYQKILHLRPGRYRLDLLIQNDEGRKGGLNSFGVVLPTWSNDAPDVRLSPIMLSHYISQIIGATQSQQFQIGDLKVVPAFENVFTSNENIGVYLQGYGFQSDPSSSGTPARVRFQIQSWDGRVIRELLDDRGSCIRPASSRIVIAERLPLTGLQKGKYRLAVRVEDPISGNMQTESADFEISG